MINALANHCAELHRRHVHLATIAIAVAASVGLYFVLPILLLAREITMSTPVIHRFRIASAQEVLGTPTMPTIPAPAPTEGSGGGPCPAGQYLGQTEKGEAQCMFNKTDTSSGGQTSPAVGPIPSQPAQQPIQVYPMPAGKTCPAGEVYAKNDQGQVNCVRVDTSANKMEQMGPNEIPEMDEEFVDPREIKNVLADIKRMRLQLKSFVTKLKKIKNTADDLARITEIQTSITEYEGKIKNPSEDESIRGNLQDFYDNNYWDEINLLRAKVELPTEIKNYTKELTRVKKLLINKTFPKLGFDMNALKGRLTEMETAIADVQAKYNGGDLEGAMEAMQEVRDSGHPGEINGVLMQTRDILQRTKSVRSKDIQALITEIIQPVIDAFNEGEFREANMVLSQIGQELMQLQNKLMRTTNLDEATSQKFEKLQQMVEDKLQNGGEMGEKPLETQRPIPSVPVQP